jgi:hypothetical protein
MVGIDPANGTEIVPGGLGIKLIKPQVFGPFDYPQAIDRYGGGDSASPPAQGTIAPPWVYQAIGQVHFEDHGTAMA